MANDPRNFDMSLLQKTPSREILMEKMRSKLASHPGPNAGKARAARTSRLPAIMAWSWKAALAALVVAVNIFLVDKKDVVLAKLGYEGVTSLPKPNRGLALDDQALYWTYAMYDIEKLRSVFKVQGYYAIDQAQARRSLEELLPRVGTATLGEISAYAPIAFRSVASGGPR